MIIIQCKACGIEVERGGSRQIYCRPCSLAKAREQKQRYADSAAGKDSNRRATAKWVASAGGRAYVTEWSKTEHGRELGAERARRQREKPETKEYLAAWQREYNKTPTGQIRYIVAAHKRRGIPVAFLREVVTEIVNHRANCYSCGRRATQVDHVLPVNMARLLGLVPEVDQYAAPICEPCHRAKTQVDIRDIRRMRKLLKMPTHRQAARDRAALTA